MSTNMEPSEVLIRRSLDRLVAERDELRERLDAQVADLEEWMRTAKAALADAARFEEQAERRRAWIVATSEAGVFDAFAHGGVEAALADAPPKGGEP